MAINPNTIYSKTGKGVQEAAGKTSHLGRGERAVLQQIDGKTNLAELQQKFDKISPAKFEAQIQQLERDGFVREVPTSIPQAVPKPAAPAPIAKPTRQPEGEEELDFTRLATPGRKAPSEPAVDLAATARAEAERRANESGEFDFRKREEAMTRARQEAEAKARAEYEEKIKAAREAAVRAAAEAKSRAQAEAMAKIEAAEKARREAEELRRQLEEQKAREATGREEAERQRAAQEQARKEAEDKAKREAEALRRELEEQRARAEAERQAREESERRSKQDAERLAREAAERAAREEAERQRAAQERVRKETEEKARLEAAALQRQLEEERRAREDAERRSREESERRAREEAERQARDAAERAAREEAERQRAAQEQARKEAEDKARLEAAALQRQLEEERRAREDAERRSREESERRAREETERQARETAERAAREKAEQERVTQEQARKEAEDKVRRDAAERTARENAERQARDAAERAAHEKADRERAAQEQARKEAEEQARREAEELRRQLGEERARADAERRAREESERLAKERTERMQAESAQRARAEAERKAREDAEREADAERARLEKVAGPGEADEEGNRKRAARALVSKAKSASSIDESLLADLDSFAKQDDEARQAQEAQARADKERAERAAREQSERAEKEAADRAAKEAADRAARELSARAARAVAERAAGDAAQREAQDADARDSVRAQGERATSLEEARREAEEERRRAREKQARRSLKAADRAAEAESEQARLEKEAERRRKAREAVAGTVLEKVIDEDLEIGEDELGFEEIERERQLFEQTAGRRERKSMPMPQERQPPPDAEPAQEPPQRRVVLAGGSRAQADDLIGTVAQIEREPVAWAKYGVIALIVLLVAGVGGVHVMPFSTGDYEKAATEALGAPVRIGSARLSLITGIQMKFERVTIGDTVQIALARAHGGIGALIGEQKLFDRVELEGGSIPQEMLGDALFGALKGANLKIARVTAKQLKFPGPVALPDLGVDLTIGGNGALQSVVVTGADGLQIKMIPGSSGLSLEGSASSFPVPIVPGLSFADFGLKGSVTRGELSISEFDGRLYEGVVSGSARVRWGATWTVEGEVRAKNVNAAVFAPALLSEGRGEGRALYSMSAADPAKLGQEARLEGSFKIDKGVLGSFDLGRAIQTNGAQSSGRTLFSELAAQFAYQGGATQLRNIAIAAGPMNAGASLDIAEGGALTGRIVADLKTPAQTMRATLGIGGKAQEPVLRR